jgi:hypothetical protein
MAAEWRKSEKKYSNRKRLQKFGKTLQLHGGSWKPWKSHMPVKVEKKFRKLGSVLCPPPKEAEAGAPCSNYNA